MPNNTSEIFFLLLLIGTPAFCFLMSYLSNRKSKINNLRIEPTKPIEPTQKPTTSLPQKAEVLDQSDSQWQECLKQLHSGSSHLIITGPAGTGKSTLIKQYQNETKKKTAIVAFTGLAALNAGGQTINSLFRLPPHFITSKEIKRVKNPEKYQRMDEVIIDEFSMVRADILDGIDQFLRKNGRDRNQPFGGARLIFVGDPFQLAPITKDDDKSLFKRIYGIPEDKEPYYFKSFVHSQISIETIRLSKIFRQKKDELFIDVLSRIRTDSANPDDLKIINQRVDPTAGPTLTNKVISLTMIRDRARYINENLLKELPGDIHTYCCSFTGDFQKLRRTQTHTRDDNLPAEEILYLKPGARVMFIKNDSGLSSRWVNGTLGTISALGEGWVEVLIDGHAQKSVRVEPAIWEKVKYEIDQTTGELKTVVTGTMKQIPLRLAWALTTHKSQGLSFDQIHVDLKAAPFTHGQTYVALSRCRSLEGLTLSSPIYQNNIIVDSEIKDRFCKD